MHHREGNSQEIIKDRPGGRISLLPGLLLFIFTQLPGQNYRPIAYFPDGLLGATISPILAYDANHNGYPELYYETYHHPYGFFKICEYRRYNRYILIDTLHTVVDYVGNLDNDDKTDLLAGGRIYESKFPNSYPTFLVWEPESAHLGNCFHVADLDQDGNMDFISSRSMSVVYIYECIGDNQYNYVWSDSATVCNFTSGDFDQDGKMEFVGSIGGMTDYVVWECCGDNMYQVVFAPPVVLGNSHDVCYGNDLDQDGKPEFIISSAHPAGGYWAYQFRVFEALTNNVYGVSFWSDIIYRPANLSAGRGSYCGDVDLDGQDELIWTIQDNWYIYKAFGNNTFQRMFTAYPDYNGRSETRVYVYDLNGNGYPEIIESGGNNSPGPDFWSETIIWEIEAVRLLYPNGGEVFQPNDTVEVKWQTFDPPGCDSLSLFFSADSGYNYDTIVTGIPASETTYQWIVPDTTSDNCMLMIWAYGPGTGWDFTDSTFAVGVGVAERKSYKLQNLRIYPNPSYGLISFDLPSDIEQITIFDATGRLLHQLSPSPHLRLTLPPGIYFLQIKTQTQTKTEKVIILK